MSGWDIILVSQVEQWYLGLPRRDAALVGEAIDLLAAHGPTLGRPLVDSVKGTRVHHMRSDMLSGWH